MSKSVPGIFAILRMLQQATADVAKLQFVVDTQEGLQLLPVDELLKLIPSTPTVDIAQAQVVTLDENQQLIEQIHAQLDSLRVQFNQHLDDLPAPYVPVAEVFHPDESVALGTDALLGGAVDRENVAIGLGAGVNLEGAGNVLVGPYAGYDVAGEMTDVVAIGANALADSIGDLTNVTALGAYSHATGSHQVVLGDHRTNAYTASSVHRRMDNRDMTDPTPLSLGLDFVLNAQPIMYREDFRDAYINWDAKPVEPVRPGDRPEPPTLTMDDPQYQPHLVAYRCQKAAWDKEVAAYEIKMATYISDLEQWVEDNQFHRITSNGTRAGQRQHLGFDFNQLQGLAKRADLDLALLQDHSVANGASVKTIAEGELIAVLFKAVQELYKEVHSATTVDRIASELARRYAEQASQA